LGKGIWGGHERINEQSRGTFVCRYIYKTSHIVLAMDLRQLKKEVEGLPRVDTAISDFQQNWVKLLRVNSNSHLPFVQVFSSDVRKQINSYLGPFQNLMLEIRQGQNINEKLFHYARSLVELKLTTLNGDARKAKLITTRLLKDEVFNMAQTIEEVREFEHNVTKLSKVYAVVNEIMEEHLSLEEKIHFTQLPHRKYVETLVKTAAVQKQLMGEVGKQFVSLVGKR